MVHAKNSSHSKKSKPRKQHDGPKKHGKQTDIAELRAQLETLGLKISQVTADGNCFFRGLADQLEGNEDEHQKYRQMVVKYIMDHREDFEPFIEDDVPFDEYCQSMEKDGTWAGHMELQAASLVTKRNICIHRLMSPRWYITNFSGQQANMIHLCYHDGEHYNSVRLKDDPCEGPAKTIIIKVDAHISSKDHNNKGPIDKTTKGPLHRRTFDSGSVKLVMAGTGCEDINKVEQVLKDVDGDVDAAIEFLIAEKELDVDENKCSNSESSKGEDSVQGEDQIHDHGQPMVASVHKNLAHESCNEKIQPIQTDNIHNQCKKKTGYKVCSCGSKKKCKTCVTETGRASSRIVLAASKGRKEPKQNKRKEAMKEIRDTGPRTLPDLGALCI